MRASRDEPGRAVLMASPFDREMPRLLPFWRIGAGAAFHAWLTALRLGKDDQTIRPRLKILA